MALGWLEPFSKPNFALGIGLLALTCTAAVVQLVDGRSVFTRVCELRMLRMLGARSYAMYVLQYFVILPLASIAPSLGDWARTVGARIALACSCVLISYLLAELSYLLYERPFLRLKRVFEAR